MARVHDEATSAEVDMLVHLPWTIEVRPYEDGTYFARVVELAGCMTEGDSAGEALEALEEARALWIASALEHGDEIPRPASEQQSYSGKIFVRTSPRLHRRVAEEAEREGVSMSQWVSEALAGLVGNKEAARTGKAGRSPADR